MIIRKLHGALDKNVKTAANLITLEINVNFENFSKIRVEYAAIVTTFLLFGEIENKGIVYD